MYNMNINPIFTAYIQLKTLEFYIIFPNKFLWLKSYILYYIYVNGMEGNIGKYISDYF